MGEWYICGTGRGCEKFISDIEKLIHDAQPNEDGTLEITVKGKSENTITVTRMNAEEIKTMNKLNKE